MIWVILLAAVATVSCAAWLVLTGTKAANAGLTSSLSGLDAELGMQTEALERLQRTVEKWNESVRAAVEAHDRSGGHGGSPARTATFGPYREVTFSFDLPWVACDYFDKGLFAWTFTEAAKRSSASIGTLSENDLQTSPTKRTVRSARQAELPFLTGSAVKRVEVPFPDGIFETYELSDFGPAPTTFATDRADPEIVGAFSHAFMRNMIAHQPFLSTRRFRESGVVTGRKYSRLNSARKDRMVRLASLEMVEAV